MYFFNVFIPSFMSPIILAVNYRSRDTIEGEIKALAGRENVWDGYMRLHGRGAYAWKFMLIGSPLLFVMQ